VHKNVNSHVLGQIFEQVYFAERSFLEQNNLHPQHPINEEKKEETANGLYPTGYVEVVR
jgi:hypothetical protein